MRGVSVKITSFILGRRAAALKPTTSVVCGGSKVKFNPCNDQGDPGYFL